MAHADPLLSYESKGQAAALSQLANVQTSPEEARQLARAKVGGGEALAMAFRPADATDGADRYHVKFFCSSVVRLPHFRIIEP
jgi:azurin